MLELIQRAQGQAERIAVLDTKGTYTYQDLLDASASVANELLDAKADLKESRVAFLVPPDLIMWKFNGEFGEREE